MPYRLIYNPTAGGGRARRLMDQLASRLAEVAELEVMATRERGHATELARAVADRADMVVISVGGDGTHHEVVNGLLPDGVAEVAVIPAGSGNDFAASLGIPGDPEAALTVALNGTPRRVDVGHAETRDRAEYFLTVVGAGFDAEVAGLINSRSRAKARTSGKALYLRGILDTLVRYRSDALTITMGDRRETRPTLLIAAGNAPRYAGGIRICPDAVMDDGLLQVVWVRGLPRLRVLPLLAQAYSGAHLKNPAVETFAADQLTVDGPDRLFVHADGEILGHLPLHVRVVPRALRIRTPEPR
jgi:diacylglycerol kinase (ATP)